MLLKTIYLSWRHGKGGGRFLVGVLSRDTPYGEDIVFRYDKDEVTRANEAGFLNYPEFADLEKEYRINIKAAFSLRLMPKLRSDRNNYLSFWHADKHGLDWFDELGFTQGKLATDTFEFMADFPKRYNGQGITFLSNVAGLTHIKLPLSSVKVGDKLRFELDTSNEFDSKAVKLMKSNQLIGFVKRGHHFFFHKIKNTELDILVSVVENNGNINQIYFTVKVK